MPKRSTRLDRLFTPAEWTALIDGLQLTKRQVQVLEGVFQGMSDKQISRKLEVGHPTVRTHLQRIYGQFDVGDRTELVIEVFIRFRDMSSD